MPFGFSRERKESSGDDHGLHKHHDLDQSDDWERGLHSSRYTHPEYPPQEEGLVYIGRSLEQRIADAHGHLSDEEIDAINAGGEISPGAQEHYWHCDECRRDVSRREKFPRNSSWE